jgi:hypothetical protein
MFNKCIHTKLELDYIMTCSFSLQSIQVFAKIIVSDRDYTGPAGYGQQQCACIPTIRGKGMEMRMGRMLDGQGAAPEQGAQTAKGIQMGTG